MTGGKTKTQKERFFVMSMQRKKKQKELHVLSNPINKVK
jgi:hypothetical protein